MNSAAASTVHHPLEVAHRRVDSPFGALLVAATDVGLVRVAFESEDHDQVLRSLATTMGRQISPSSPVTDATAHQLDEYFAGDRRRFELPLDLRLVTGFRRTVIDQLASIAYGTTQTYGQLAAAAGNPGAVRAVGSACARNPVPVVIPCHRVVRRDGSIGQYLGGTETKAALLALEAGP